MLNCFRELSGNFDVRLCLVYWPQSDDVPLNASFEGDFSEVHLRSRHDETSLLAVSESFAPDAVLVCGWSDKGYLRVCRKLKSKGVPIVSGCDTQWNGSLRQQVAGWTAMFHLHRSIDVLWVSGERQRTFALALGYDGDRCWEGYYACGWESFAKTNRVQRQLPCEPSSKERHFLYVGRYAPEKGIATLIKGYEIYRSLVEEPWKLVCAGSGPLHEAIQGDGVEDRGFVQPDDLPDLMAAADCFVLASDFEPWGVVVQEAASSSLPLICSDACGAGVHLLRDFHNGFRFEAGSAEALAERMVLISRLDEIQYREFCDHSFELSKQYTPDRWGEILVNGLEKMTGRVVSRK